MVTTNPPNTARSDPELQSPDGNESQRRSVSLRSVLVGLLCTAGISVLAPFNDLLLANTFLIGGTLPVGLLVFFLLLVSLVNAPLRRFAPMLAMSGGELAVAFGIALVGCAVPAVGFNNYVFAIAVGLWTVGGEDPQVARLLESMDLPDWLFPISDTSNAQAAAHDPTLTHFLARIPSGSGDLPWDAWLVPVVVWGLWLVCFGGAVLCLSLVLRRQWVENERLTFPVATVYTQLLEEPERGRAFNRLLRSWSFWLCLAGVFAVRSVNALAVYFPTLVPALPLGFDLTPLLSDPPFSHAHTFLKIQPLFFAVIGITFLLQTRIAFSLWFFYLLYQFAVMVAADAGAEFTQGMQQDQMAGSLVVFAGMVLWIGRAHWGMVLRSMFGRRRAGDVDDPYVPYRWAGWGLLLFAFGMVIFLAFAGASIPAAVVVVLTLLLVVMMVARIAAETGLYYIQINLPLFRTWSYLLAFTGLRTTTASFFWTAWVSAVHTHDTREPLSSYALYALKLNDELAPPRRRSRGVLFVASLFLSLIVAYVVGGASLLNMEYRHAATFGEQPVAPVNSYGVEYVPGELILKPTSDYDRAAPAESHSHLAHLGIGAGLTFVLGLLRLQYASWPLHPLGFLLAYTFPIGRMWFSIFLGWLAKVLAVRYVGSGAIVHLRDLAIGLVVGEAVAVGFWLIVALALASQGQQFHPIYITP